MTTPGSPLMCPRCGRRSVPAGGPFCPYCGRYLAPLQWVAEPPPSAAPARREPPRGPYTGPPRYPFLPRWGFRPGPWVRPQPVEVPDSLRTARTALGVAVPLLWATAAVALLAAVGEVWRYVLLLASRAEALSAGAVAASDAFVSAAGTVAPIVGLLAGAALVLWSVRATQAAADQAAVRPTRSVRAIVLGWLIPGANLSLPGSVLTEIEHAGLDRPPAQRPRPSGLLLGWWVLWAAGVVLSVIVVLWSLRTGVQARADGVVLHAVLDLLAAVTAGVTAVLIGRLTRLLGPVRADRRELLVSIGSAAPGTQAGAA